jgi:dihydroneopterin aldolase
MLITIERYPVFIKLGHFPRERILGQEVFVSLEVELAPHLAAVMQDNLDETVDYAMLLATIDRELARQEIKLVETAVIRVGNALLALSPLIVAVEVRLEKPVLPEGMNKGARVSVAHRFVRGENNASRYPRGSL